MKDDYFLDDSSLSEYDLKSSSMKSKSQALGFKVNNMPRIPSLAIGRTMARSDSSFNKSKRHKKLLEMDSDIRELDNLGLLQHGSSSKRNQSSVRRQGSARSKSSARSGELSPIKKDKNRVKVSNHSQNFDYSENVFKIRKTDESARQRKVIRDEQSGKQAVVLKAVLKLQRFFRIRRLQRWYKEVLSGKLFGIMLKCEKIINDQKYLVSFSIEKGENSLCVLIKAQPLNSISTPDAGRYSLFEVCSIINAWNTKSFEMRKSELLIHIFIENSKVVLRKSPEISMVLAYQGSKKLNNMFSYQISIYTIISPSSEPSLLIDGRSLKKSPPIVRVLIISVKELSSILSVKTQDLERHLDKVLSLVIFEGEGELTLSKRSLCPEIPIINIFTTNTDDFTDQYKQYEMSSKRVHKYEGSNIKFCVGNSDQGRAAVVIQKNLKAIKERKKFIDLKSNFENLQLKCTLTDFYKAVVIIQKFIRGWKARRLRKKKQDEAQKAAVVIQACFRGWKTRQALPLKKDLPEQRGQEDLHKAAVLIQSKFRSHKARTDYLQQKQKVFKATVIIRCAVRRWLKKKKKIPQVVKTTAKNPRSLRLHAILCIQKFIKGWRARRYYKELKKSAVYIQKHFRGFSSRKAFKAKMVEVRALKIVQRFVRRWLKKRRRIREDQAKLVEASVVIQKHYKGHKARLEFLEKRERERQNKILGQVSSEDLIKQIFRCILSRQILLNRFEEKSLRLNSAIKIQSKFRGFKCRKNYLSSLSLMVHAKAGKNFMVVLKAALLIKKFVRGWKVRKNWKLKKNEADNYLKAVITLQKYIKGWKARKQMDDLKNGNLVIDRFGALLNENPFLVSVSRTSSHYVIRAVHSLTQKVLYATFEVENQSFDQIVENLCIQNEILSLSETKTRKPFKFQLFDGQKSISNSLYQVKVTLEPTFYSISLESSSKTLNSRINFSDIVEKYSDKIIIQDLVNDLRISGEKVMLESNIILVKKSKIIMDKIYTITMFEKGSFLIFDVMNGSSWKKKILVGYEEATDRTGVTGKVALGHYIIEHCLIIRGRKIFVVYRKKKRDDLNLILRIQAYIRGYITRKRLKKRNLVLITEKLMKSQMFRVYCHYYLGKFNIVAQTKDLNLNLLIEKALPANEIRDYLRKEVLPLLALSESLPYKLLLVNAASVSEKIPAKGPKVHPNITGKTPLNFMAITPNLTLASKRPSDDRISLEKSAVLRKRGKKPSNCEESSNPLTSEPLSPQMTPTIQLKKTRMDFEETMKSLNLEKIVLKTGTTISGIYLIITMKLQEDGVYVQACNETGIIELDLFIKTKRVRKINDKQIEDLCSELLSQLKIVSGMDGKMRLALIDNSEDSKDEVIYRRSHYISNRYLTITIFENFRGIFLIASEGDKNVFNMKLGRRRVGNSQKTQEELSELVKKLKVQVVLGQEMLVLST
jgi:hypothetical protein